MAEPELKRFGNSSQPTSTSDLVKTVYKKFSGNVLKDDVLPEIEKADDLDKSEEFSESDNEICGDILQIRDGFDLIKSVDSEEKVEDFVDKLLPFEHNDDQRLKKQEDIEPTSKILEEFIGESDVGVKWKAYIPTDDIAFPDKKAENKDNCLTEVHGQINDVERMELDYSLNAVVESKTSVEPAKSINRPSNDLFGNANDLFGIGNALVDNSDALINNVIVSVLTASGNGNATDGIQPNDRSNTLPSLYPYKSIPQKPPDPTQYTISPELKKALHSNLLLKSKQTRRALQGERQGEGGGVNERFHPYKRQTDKSQKLQTTLPKLPEFE